MITLYIFDLFSKLPFGNKKILASYANNSEQKVIASKKILLESLSGFHKLSHETKTKEVGPETLLIRGRIHSHHLDISLGWQPLDELIAKVKEKPNHKEVREILNGFDKNHAYSGQGTFEGGFYELQTRYGRQFVEKN